MGVALGAAVQAQTAPNEWTWTDGSSTVGTDCYTGYPCGQPGVYGTKGTMASGNIPGSRTDAMSWTDKSGRKWLFGGFGYIAGVALGDQDDLWQANSAGTAWEWVSGHNAPGYAGTYPATVGTATSTTVPGGREGGATWVDKNGNLWLFGGLGYDGTATSTGYGYENDLWMYNPTTNQWTWESGSSAVPPYTSDPILGTTTLGSSAGVYGTLGTPATGNTPGGRLNATAWTDSSGNLWLFGGGYTNNNGISNVDTLFNDLWEFNTSTMQWTWEGGGQTSGNSGVYGTLGAAASGNIPGARYQAGGWTDLSGNFWLFGGYGFDVNGYSGSLNDLWQFNPNTFNSTTNTYGEWTWESGSESVGECFSIIFGEYVCDLPGSYGTQGTAGASNSPGDRTSPATWTDSSGNLWLFGGSGADANDNAAWLNDLWEFNPNTPNSTTNTNGEWTWMGGGSTIPTSCTTGNCGQPGVYGSLGTAASANVPGARLQAVSWTDQSGDFWLFGGWGIDENGAVAYLNDMWEYQPSTTALPTAATPTFSVTPGTYGAVQSVTISDTTSGATIYYTTNGTTPTAGSSLYDGAIPVSSTETLEAIAVVASGYYNSAVATAAYTINLPAAATPTFSVAPGTYATAQSVTISDATPGETIYYSTNGTTPTTGSSVYSSALTVSSTETLEAIATASGYSASAVATAAYTITPSTTGASNEWVWMGGSSTVGSNGAQPGVNGTLGTPAAGNIPAGRQYASTWTDSSGNLWVFGGNSVGLSGNGTLLNDLWKFNPATNQWAWISGGEGEGASIYTAAYYAGVYGTMGVPAAGNTPGGRNSAATWIDNSGNLWLFGGNGTDIWGNQVGALSDLWEFNPSTSLWTWMGGSDNLIYPLPAVYGTLGTPADANFPGARQGATTWTDSSGNFWLFGGSGLNDLWKYNPSTNQWTWVTGSSAFGPGNCFSTQTYSLCGIPGVFGTLGTPAAGNTPGSSQYPSAWTDSSGNFWLFGGYGTDSRNLTGDLNDLWEFNPSTNEWTWMGGSQLGPWDQGTPAVYGTMGTFAASNLPGGRQGGASWTDSSGNFWLFGGNGLDVSGGVTATGGTGDLNDLWEYSPSKGYWAWMGGSNSVGTTGGGQPGVYGTLGTAAAGNVPGGREYFANFTDKSGNFWLFGGAGYDSTDTAGYLNDVWEYQNPTGATTTLSPAPAPTFGQPTGTYVDTQTFTISDTIAGATIYYTIGLTELGVITPTINSTVYNGAFTLSDLGFSQTIQAFVTAPGYAPSTVATVVYNLTVPVEQAAATPIFSPVAGTYSSAQTVTITDATPGATIYYTTDGSTPTIPGASFTSTTGVYSSPITISSTDTVNALAVAFNYYNSAVASGTFTIAPPVASPIGNWAWMGGSSSIPGTEYGQPGVYGTLSTPAAGNIPGGRDNGATWTDHNGNLWLFGGFGYDATGAILGLLNDLWQLNPATNQWTWMGGSNTLPTCASLCEQAGVYGTLGTPAAGNIPGGRSGAATWTDSGGHLWLFGGSTFDATSNVNGLLNDLWEFNPSTGLWAWMGGSSTIGSDCVGTAPNQTCGQPGVYSTLGTAAAANIPGTRAGAATWIDSSGHLWLFGGYGFDAAGIESYLNDVWEFNTSTSQWTWMGGSSVGVSGGQPGVYGTLGTASAANIPGSRALASTWTDGSGHFWLFGGTNPTTTGPDDFNDLWEFNPSTNQWTWMGGSSTIGSNCALTYFAQYPTCGQPGVYGTSGSPAAANIPGGRSSAASWIDSSGNLWLFGGTGMDSAGSTGLLDDLWSFSPSTNQWAWMGGSNLIGSACLLGPTDTCGQPGIYGTLGSPAVENIPGSREGTSSWTDSSGHFWLFGGIGIDANGSHVGLLNDVWEYQPSSTGTGTPATATPTFSVPGGNYSSVQSVTISDTTPGATIYYTTNGTTPTTSSTVYNGTAISVSGTEIIEAIATASNYTTSAVATAAYEVQVIATTTTPTVTVTPASSSITTAQSLSVAISLGGGQCAAVRRKPTGATVRPEACSTITPTGTVTLSGGGYTSAAATLSGGSATIIIPAGSLTTGTDTLTATYTPDSNSSSIYTSATGTNPVTVTAAVTTVTPTVTVTPASSGITTDQSLSVAISVSSSSPCEDVRRRAAISAITPEIGCTSATSTGTVTLTGGGYTSAAATLSGGAATITIPAGSLATGTDTLTATYTPDSNSASTYASGTGTNTVTVTAAPNFTVASSTGTQTVQPGGAATYTINVNPVNGAYSSVVTLTASGLPTGATASFVPATVTPGSAAATSTLTIQTAAPITTAANSRWPLATPLLALIGLFFVPGKRRRRWITLGVLLIASLSALTALSGCGGGFAITKSSQTYTITVTGTSGADVQTTTVQLTVQ
jgi:N-acetylneuraminic acid mutarotase